MTLRIGERIRRPCIRCGKYFLPTSKIGRICEDCSMNGKKYKERKRQLKLKMGIK